MISYGIDIGTTTLRAIATSIKIENFGKRRINILGEALCTYTPYLPNHRLNEKEILEILEAWRKEFSIPPPEVGTVLFTGEAQRAPNAVSLGKIFTSQWPGILSAQLDPALESRIAALGSEALELSTLSPGKSVIHIDVGGGTSNFAHLKDGKMVDRACLDIGARKWILEESTGKLLYETRQGHYFSKLVPGRFPEIAEARSQKMAQFILEYARGSQREDLRPLVVVQWKNPEKIVSPILSLSGGIVEENLPKTPFPFGDLGPLLFSAIREQATKEKIPVSISPYGGKATAFGVSSYGFQVAGRSVEVPKAFPKELRNAPLYWKKFPETVHGGTPIVIYLGDVEPHLESVQTIAQSFRERLIQASQPILFLFSTNVAKTFGYCLEKLSLPSQNQIAALDEISLEENTAGLTTVDFTEEPQSERYVVVVKTLRLF